MKERIREIIGKTISGVIVARNENPALEPRHHVFLVFSDSTYFEFYGEDLRCAGGVDPGGYIKAREYAEYCMGAKIKQEYRS